MIEIIKDITESKYIEPEDADESKIIIACKNRLDCFVLVKLNYLNTFVFHGMCLFQMSFSYFDTAAKAIRDVIKQGYRVFQCGDLDEVGEITEKMK